MEFFIALPLSDHNAWIILVAAIFCSAIGTTCLKFLAKTGQYRYLIGVIGGYACFLISITLVLKWIDMGVGYAVWSGLSTLLMTLSGVFFFKEKLGLRKVGSLICIIVGVVILSLVDSF